MSLVVAGLLLVLNVCFCLPLFSVSYSLLPHILVFWYVFVTLGRTSVFCFPAPFCICLPFTKVGVWTRSTFPFPHLTPCSSLADSGGNEEEPPAGKLAWELGIRVQERKENLH